MVWELQLVSPQKARGLSERGLTRKASGELPNNSLPGDRISCSKIQKGAPSARRRPERAELRLPEGPIEIPEHLERGGSLEPNCLLPQSYEGSRRVGSKAPVVQEPGPPSHESLPGGLQEKVHFSVGFCGSRSWRGPANPLPPEVWPLFRGAAETPAPPSEEARCGRCRKA